MLPALQAWDHRGNGSSVRWLPAHDGAMDRQPAHDGPVPFLQPWLVTQLTAALLGPLAAYGIARALASAPHVRKILRLFLASGGSHHLHGSAQATIGQSKLIDDGLGVEPCRYLPLHTVVCQQLQDASQSRHAIGLLLRTRRCPRSKY